MFSRRAKGKGRAAVPLDDPIPPGSLRRRGTEGAGGSDGIVVPLEYVADGPYDVTYSLPILVGSGPSPQNMSLQVDTGSSDLWIASTSCGSSVCGKTPRYNPTTAVPTNHDFTIQYLAGKVSGPIVWDTVNVGGYSIDNQALAAANSVESEPLSSQFSGVLGLALPTNSYIADQIPPGLGDAPDGAVLASNLFSITPLGSAPPARFLSVALERPGSSTVPSVLGIGRHPAALVPDPARIAYDTLYGSSSRGPVFWKAAVHGITVYTETARIPVELPRGVGGVFPSAVLDTGVPLILTTRAIADAIYNSIGIQAAADNMYYVPCTTPLNLTFSLDFREEIAVHPLDLTTEPPATSSSPHSCIGLIQTSADATLKNPASGIGDMILGVPFMRNVYTVLAFDAPAANGSFPLRTANATLPVRPRLGLLNLTNPTIALNEFHRVRVLNQPLGDANPMDPADRSGAHRPNVGIDVLIGLAGFVGLCVLLFGVRWLAMRRHADAPLGAHDAKDGRELARLGGYQLARRGGGGAADDGLPSEDELRARRYEAYMHSLHTVSTDRTLNSVGEDGVVNVAKKEGSPLHWQEPLLLQHDVPPTPASPLSPLPASPRDNSAHLPEHAPESARHSRVLSVHLPLLPDEGGGGAEDDPASNRHSMAGIGTARHSAKFRARHSSMQGFGPDQ
ncbi:aspartic peptidase domain-containing protein [Mycena belliarum]|uniref:Aspartic peptidase domain-containing protein n=1 Tax=Mycena belliarum TaxID=1033014 RepID=A0AAD6UDH7_9AGAR|nr:aspartic peptidase domain-containing protein [Mycena belliae]